MTQQISCPVGNFDSFANPPEFEDVVLMVAPVEVNGVEEEEADSFVNPHEVEDVVLMVAPVEVHLIGVEEEADSWVTHLRLRM